MTGYIRQDEDGHWYFIPAKEVDKFDELQGKLYETNYDSNEYGRIEDDFIDRFSQYQINDPFGLKLKLVA